MIKKVIVASANPVKIRATENGFKRMFCDKQFAVEGISVPSGVSDQPMSNAETITGAQNRVINLKKVSPMADYWVGIEGGVEEYGGNMEAFAWVVVHSRDGEGKARTATFFLPPPVADLIKQGVEMGDADDIVFGKSNSKQKNGAVGLLTGDVLNRTTYYEPAVILALIPFKNRELYQIDK